MRRSNSATPLCGPSRKTSWPELRGVPPDRMPTPLSAATDSSTTVNPVPRRVPNCPWTTSSRAHIALSSLCSCAASNRVVFETRGGLRHEEGIQINWTIVLTDTLASVLTHARAATTQRALIPRILAQLKLSTRRSPDLAMHCSRCEHAIRKSHCGSRPPETSVRLSLREVLRWAAE